MSKRYQSWGRYPKAPHHSVVAPTWRDGRLPERDGRPLLAYGLGRSYGDSCLNEGGVLLDTTALNRFIAFDREAGVLRAEAGLSLKSILDVIVPAGWFLPVTPGTKFITLGGAIANDVHGKNHHSAGTFGRHVTRFELLRSDGERLLCSPTENSELFRATIGGLGLTGLITWAEITLRRIESAMIVQDRIRFDNLDEFFEISAASDKRFEYSVSWIDCQAQGRQLGRGIFMRGNHATGPYPLEVRATKLATVPFDLPSFTLNPLTIGLFNQFYYRFQLPKSKHSVIHYDPFFYPLDIVSNWNRIYGEPGFMEYQFVIPHERGHTILRRLMAHIAASKQGFLNVFKEFGDLPSPGMLSFPRPGITLAMDFPNRGERTLRLFNELDEFVREAGGVLYPAKDARMAPADFQRFYPQWRDFARFIDPAFSSSFWRRVTTPVALPEPMVADARRQMSDVR